MAIDPEALPIPDLGLLCPDCGYPLVGLPAHRCPECGRQFKVDELIPPGDCPVLYLEGRDVKATNELRELLRAAQIYFVEETGIASKLYGAATAGTPRLAVPRAMYLETLDLLQRWNRGEPVTVPEQAGTADWTCPRCGESNPPNFEMCWSCNDNRPN